MATAMGTAVLREKTIDFSPPDLLTASPKTQPTPDWIGALRAPEADLSGSRYYSDLEPYSFSGTPLGAQLATPTYFISKQHDREQINSVDRLDAECSTRVTLLARKYAEMALSKEDEARLQIATERLRILAPRVTIIDFEELAQIGEKFRANSESLKHIRDALGLGE